VLAVGAIVVGAINHHGSNSPTESAGSAALPEQQLSNNGGGVIDSLQPRNFVESSTGRAYTRATLTFDVQNLVAAPTDSTLQPATPSATAKHGGSARALGSTDRKEAKKQPDTTRSSVASGFSPLATQPVPKVLQPLASSRAKILACAARLTTTKNAVPVAVDFGTWTDPNPPAYNDSPSAFFVFKTPNPSSLAVFVIGPTCNGSFKLFAHVAAP
jgi:hypothetical protein